MSLLFFLWFFAAAIILATFVLALFRTRKKVFAPKGLKHIPVSFGEFLVDQFHDVLYHASYAAHEMKPHAKQIYKMAVVYLTRLHRVFTERVFGGIASKRGNSASFFLKHIAEYKQSQKGEGK